MMDRLGWTLALCLLANGALAQTAEEEGQVQLRRLYGLMEAGLEYCPTLTEVPGMRDVFQEAVINEAGQAEVEAAKVSALETLKQQTLDAKASSEETCAGLAQQFSPGTQMPLFMTP